MTSQIRQTVFGRVFLSVFAALALMIGAGAFVGLESGQAGLSTIPELPSENCSDDESLFPTSGSFAPIVKLAAPAVVSVQVVKEAVQQPMLQGSPGFGNPFGPGPQPEQRRQRGAGSGVIISDDGYVVTNHHVVEGADEVTVVLSDDRTFDATVVGSDEKTDIAVLKIDGEDLPLMKLGNSNAVEVGDIVLAIGNPFGLGQTVTMGIVGATGREFGIMRQQQGYEDFIQTDAAINPGNSGGALVNARGELVGVNSAIVSRSGGNNGVGFAVPVNLAHSIMKQLVDTGRVSRGYMGVKIQDITEEMAKSLDLPDSRGVVISRVDEGSPADQAGFKRYDVVRSIAGKSIRDMRELRLGVASTPPGEEVEMAIIRDGESQMLSIELGELPDGGTRPTTSGTDREGVLSGVTVDDLTPQVASQLGVEGDGVVVTQVAPGSAAAEAGLQRGDVIQEVDRHEISSVDQFRDVVAEAGDSVLLLVTGRNGSHFVVVER
jgi:serine protease Do